jgi:hypothetical protein
VKQALLRVRWTFYAIVPTLLVFLIHTNGKRWF